MNINNVKLFVVEKNQKVTKKMIRDNIIALGGCSLVFNAPFMILGVFRISPLIWLALLSVFTFMANKIVRMEKHTVLRTNFYWGSYHSYMSLLTFEVCVKALILSGNIILLPFLILISVLNVIVSIKLVIRRVNSHNFKPKPLEKRILYGKTGSACCIAAYYLTRLIVPRLNLSQREIRIHAFVLMLFICQTSLYAACTFYYRAYLTRKYCPDIKSDCEENA